MEAKPTWLSLKEVASEIGMSVHFVRNMIEQKRIEVARPGGKCYRIHRDVLDAWMRSQVTPQGG